MTPETFNNKRIIWESKERQTLLIATFFLFVATAIWTRDKSSAFLFWTEIIFCGACGLSLLVRFLSPKNLFVSPDSQLAKQILAEQFSMEREDLDLFTDTYHGFSIENRLGATSYDWAHIETVFGYKQGYLATGDICMDIFTNDNAVWRLTESTPGWYQFQKRLSESIPSIPNITDEEISVPAFETELTLLFDRKGRALQDVKADCYETDSNS